MKTPPVHHLGRSLASENGELLIGGTRLSSIVARAGGTPFYVYDRAQISRRVSQLRKQLPDRVHIHYAIKANPYPPLVQYIAPLVDGLDIASAGELQVALDAGADPSLVSFAGPGKREAEIHQAIAAGVTINVESEREIELAERFCELTGRTANLAVRVNPSFELKSSGMSMGGGAKVFGIDEERVPAAINDIIGRGLNFQGLHIYSGSQNLRAENIVLAQAATITLALQFMQTLDVKFRTLNIGGGFGIPYFPGDVPLDLGIVGDGLSELLHTHKDSLSETEIIVELGRYIVGESGYYVCKILDRKLSRGQLFLVTDGGLHHHLAASGNFGQVIRKNYPVVIGNRLDQREAETGHVVGPLCTPLDILGSKISLPLTKVSDLVVVLQSGAYGLTASPVQFLGHPPPGEIMV